MECALCRVGTTKSGKVTVILEKGQSIILIKEVPAEVCTNCEHYYLSDEITRLVLEKGKEAFKAGAELEVFKLQVA